MRSPEEWEELCEQISVGFVPSTGKRSTFASGQTYRATYLQPLQDTIGLWHDGATVVDVGSGNGRLAMALAEEPVTYHGLEVIRGSVEFCQMAFAEYSSFHFHHLDVLNGHYNPKGKVRAEGVSFPLPGEIADLVIASSLFTHLVPLAAAKRYLSEMARILKPGGKLYSTWFRSPPNAASSDEAFTIWPESTIRRVLAPFTWLHCRGGWEPGRDDQWHILVSKKET